MTRHPDPVRTGIVWTQTARIVEMIKLLITNRAEISVRSHDGKDTDTARWPQEPVLSLDTDNRRVDVAEVPGTARVRQEGSEHVGQLAG